VPSPGEETLARVDALPFFKVCSYSIDGLEHSDALDQFSNACAEHGAVTSGIFAQRSLDIN
jgi:hypothetical protein